MKKLVFILFLSVGLLKGQVKLDDFGRITLNPYLSENSGLPAESQKLLLNKLNQIVVNNGISGSQVNPRFVITAEINIGTKDIIAGPPQMIAQNMDVTIFIGDAMKNSKFSSVTLSLKGVGTNENSRNRVRQCRSWSCNRAYQGLPQINCCLVLSRESY